MGSTEDDEEEGTEEDDEDDSMEEKEVKEVVETVVGPRTIKKVGSFVESFLTVKSKETPTKASAEKAKTSPKAKVTPTPRKPRRINLISTSRKSPLKGGFSRFEAVNDASDLDKNGGGDIAKVTYSVFADYLS